MYDPLGCGGRFDCESRVCSVDRYPNEVGRFFAGFERCDRCLFIEAEIAEELEAEAWEAMKREIMTDDFFDDPRDQ